MKIKKVLTYFKINKDKNYFLSYINLKSGICIFVFIFHGGMITNKGGELPNYNIFKWIYNILLIN